MTHEPLLRAVRRYLDAELYLDDSHPPAERRRLAQNVRQARERLEQTLTAAEQQQRVRRPMFQRVLVAVDGSATAHAAIATAAELAAAEVAATVALLHVVDTSGTIAARPLTAATAARDQMMRCGEDLLRQLDALVPADVRRELLLREGVAADEIIGAAGAWRADLIVMGSRGLGRLGRFLLGSTTEAVIRRARQPVLVVTHDAPPTADAPHDGTTASTYAAAGAHP